MSLFSQQKFPLLLITILFAASSYGADTRSERLWLPASAAHLRPFLQKAVDLALEDENCTDVLYARLNDYRTTYEEPTFTILCKKDAKNTFNRVVAITEVDPDYHAKIQQSEKAADTARVLSPEVEALRSQLLAPSAVGNGGQQTAPAAAPSKEINEDPNDLSLDLDKQPRAPTDAIELETHTDTPAASTSAPAPAH